MDPLDYFLCVLPPDHLQKIVTATSERLNQNAQKEKTVGEILRFFGILVMISRVEFRERRTLWV